MQKWAALALLSVWLASPALAADMLDCSAAGRDYRTLADQQCFLLCRGVGTTSGVSCGPSSLPDSAIKGKHELTVGFGNAGSGAGCTTGTFSIDWCATASCASPRVPQTFASLTGVGTSDTSSKSIAIIPAKFYQARFPTITDGNCDSGGSGTIDVFILVR